MNDKNIGFIGLGNVGSKLAFNILKSGYKLNIFDINKSSYKKLLNLGAVKSNSIKEVVTNSTVIITCLPSPKIVSKVVLEFLPHLKKNDLWIEISTTDEKEMIRLSKLCEKNGAESLESPITGGEHRAKSGNISIFAAGKRKNFKRAFPILSCIGHKILYCGKTGNASTLKIITNYLASVHLLALGEALMVGKKYKLNLELVYNAIKISSGNSFVNETETKVILGGSYDVGFTMDLVNKDVGLFDKLTNKFNIQADLNKLINKKFKQGLKKYGKRAFSTKIVKLLEDECNESLRAKSFPKFLLDAEKKHKGIEVKN